MKKYLLTSMLCILTTLTLRAQYTIYPVPQKMDVANGTCQLTDQVCILADDNIDEATISRAKQVFADHSMTADVYASQQEGMAVLRLVVDKSVAVADKYDAHRIMVARQADGNAEIVITGQHTDAVFFGLASIEQVLEQVEGALQLFTINDYADQQQRGLVEGYYGYPYSVAVKKDLMRFMMRMKMNTYLYGAKSDPYHHAYWKDPYPETITPEQESRGWMTPAMVRDLSATSAATKVNFIWAIHPGNEFLGSATALNDIMSKYEKMYDLGVRQFGVFVDDVGIPSSDADMQKNADRIAQLQRMIEQKWNAPGTLAADTVKPIHFVPQIYCRSFAGSQDQYERFFRALASTPQHIVIYTTGYGVWSVPNSNDFNMPRQFLGRNVSWWWNYPCNDNADAQIYPMDMYSNFKHMPAVGNNSTVPKDLQNGLGIVCNPMQQGEVAKIPLFSAADYAWNNSEFDNIASWEASFSHILPPVQAEALRTAAPYLTKYDPANAFGSSQSLVKMRATIDEQLAALQTLREMKDSDDETQRLMWRDLEPWALKLEAMLQATNYFLNARYSGNTEERWLNYVAGVTLADSLDIKPEYIVATIEGMGANPAIGQHRTMPAQNSLGPYLKSVRLSAGNSAYDPSYVSCLTNTSYNPMLSSGDEIYLSLTGKPLAPGEYVGIALDKPLIMNDVYVSDALCRTTAVFLSEDGVEWNSLMPTGASRKCGNVLVKYLVVYNNTDQEVTPSLSKSTFRLVPVTKPTISEVAVPSGNDYNNRASLTDGDYDTWWCLNKNQVNNDKYTLTLSAPGPISRVRVGIGTVNGDYMKSARVEISEDGVKWTKLTTASNKTTFGIIDMKDYSSECKIIDLYANGEMAKYIRLTNTSANTNKWLRLYEIEPFFILGEDPVDRPEVCDNMPNTYSHYAKGDTLTYKAREVATVSAYKLYTDHGIFEVAPTEADQSLNYVFGQDTRLFEVKVITGSAPEELTDVPAIKAELTTAAASHAARTYDLHGRHAGIHAHSGILIHSNGKKHFKK